MQFHYLNESPKVPLELNSLLRYGYDIYPRKHSHLIDRTDASFLEAIYGVANKLDLKTISAFLASILIKIFNHIASFFLRLFQVAHHGKTVSGFYSNFIQNERLILASEIKK